MYSQIQVVQMNPEDSFFKIQDIIQEQQIKSESHHLVFLVQ